MQVINDNLVKALEKMLDKEYYNARVVKNEGEGEIANVFPQTPCFGYTISSLVIEQVVLFCKYNDLSYSVNVSNSIPYIRISK